eukprot:1029062-Pelagomonas_calceolata.AAC.1
MTIPNPGLARKLLSLSIPGIYRLLQSGIQLQEWTPLEQPEPYLAPRTSQVYAKNVRNDPIRNARHAVMPGIGKCEKLPLDKKQIAKVPHKPASDITAPIPC